LRPAPISLNHTIGEEVDFPLGDLIEDSQAVAPVDAVSFVQLQDDLHWNASAVVPLDRRR
jgi:RNA polymerase primary sigma factor